MKQETVVWAKFESSGKPADTLIFQSPIREVIFRMAKWLTTVYMGNHITIRLARIESDLYATSRQLRDSNLDNELAEMLELAGLGGTPEGDHINQPALNDSISEVRSQMTPQILQCPHGESFAHLCMDCKREHNKATA